MKKVHKLVASILAMLMLLTSTNFAAIAAELADAATEEASKAITTINYGLDGGELPLEGIIDGIDIDWENYVAESTGTKFTRDYTLGLTGKWDDVPTTCTEDRFNFVRESLPDEVPCFAPYTRAEIDASKTKFYVAPNGDDKNPGTIDAPFATPERAVKAVNNLSSKRGGVTVYFRGGLYSLSKSLSFNRKTSGLDEKNLVFFSNYEDEKVTFVGAAAVSGKEFKPANDAKFKAKISSLAQPYIVSVNLKELGFKDMGTWSASTRPSLYVDGAVYEIARWPNGANTSMAQYTGKDAQFGVKNKGYQTTSSETGAAGSGTGGFAFKYSNSRPRNWEFTNNIWMYGYCYAEWTKAHLNVVKFDYDEQIAYGHSGLAYGGKYVKGNTYYYYNIFEELDQPGEWFLDPDTGILYIYPIGQIKDDSVVQLVTTSFDIITTNAAKYTVINEIGFDMGNRAVVYTNDSMYNIVQRCHIKNMANYALTAESAMYCGFIANLIEPNNSIQIYGDSGNSKSFMRDPKRTGNFAQNNYCKRIQVGSAKGNVMSHNLLNGSQGMGLYVNGGGENIVEYNEVVAGPDEQLDAGSIYVNGGATNYGNTIRYNYLNKSTPKMRSSPYCVYLDDISSGQFVYGNILREGRTYLHAGSYNTLYNNFTFGCGDGFNAMQNSNNYNLTAERWNGWVLTGTRYTSGNPGHYSLTWMDRFPYIYYWHSTLIGHRYDFQNNPNYDPTELGDPVGWKLTSPKENVYANNVFLSARLSIETAVREKDEVNRNNYDYNAADVEKFQFVDYERGILDSPDEVWAELCPGVEPLKRNVQFGIVYDPATIPVPMKLGAINPQSPADDGETPILATGVVLKWNEVYGKSSYNVKLAKDPEFKDIVLDQEQQGESVALPELEYDQQYWWTVTTNMWTNKFDQTPVQMPVATFKTMTLEDAENFMELDTSTLEANIAEMRKYIAETPIVEEGSPEAEGYPSDLPLYKAGTKAKMQQLYEETLAKYEAGFKKQREIDEINATVLRDFYMGIEENALPYTVEIGKGSHAFNAEDAAKFKENAVNLGVKYNGDTLVMDGKGTGMLASQQFSVSSGATVKANLLYEKLSGWTGFTFKSANPVSGSFTAMIGYGLVFKPDIIELQRYPKVGNDNGIIQIIQNNEEICRSGVPFDVEASAKSTKDGVHIIVKIDGNTIVDYVDKVAPDAVIGPGYYGFMHNNNNIKTTVSPATGATGGAGDGFVSVVALEKAITEASKFEATITEGAEGEGANYKVGAKAKLKAAIETAKAAKDTVTSKDEVTAAVEALNAVVSDVRINDSNNYTYVLRELDLSLWKNTSPLSIASIEENGGIIAIVPDEGESTNYEFKQLLTSRQMMKFGLKYDNTGNWAAINTRKVTSGVSPTQSRGYFFVIKDDLIEFQKYTDKSKGAILVTIENNNQIVKPGITHEIEVGSVNVEGGVLSKLIVDGETIIEYLDTEEPIYEQGYFSFYVHKDLGRVALSAIADK